MPDLKQLPWVVVTETNVTLDGRVSLSATPLVADGPALCTAKRVGQLLTRAGSGRASRSS